MDFKKYTPRYKSLCEKHFGIQLSDQEALDETIRLFNFAKAATKPTTKVIDIESVRGGDEKKKPP